MARKSEKTTIAISLPTWQDLTQLKDSPDETYGDVVVRLVAHYKKTHEKTDEPTPNGGGCPPTAVMPGA